MYSTIQAFDRHKIRFLLQSLNVNALSPHCSNLEGARKRERTCCAALDKVRFPGSCNAIDSLIPQLTAIRYAVSVYDDIFIWNLEIL